METLMLGLVLIVLALAIPISAAEMFKRWVGYKEAELAARGNSTEQQALADRVKVLERIVTDKGFDVAQQIEALREERRLDTINSGVPLNLSSRETA